MKRFIIGLICGIGLSGATVTVAAMSNEVKAILFPTILSFNVDGISSSISEDVSVLNYGNRLYIPLRVFAEKLGSTVTYHAPEPGGTTASVDILKVDKRDMTVQDKNGYVGIGHITVQFAEKPASEISLASIKGTIMSHKPIPKGKQVVLEILDKNNVLQAVTQIIRPRYNTVSGMAAGEAATFEVSFPYLAPVEEYQLQAKIIDDTPWNYTQVDGVITGAGGLMGDPLAVDISTEHEVKQGKPVNIRINLLNLSQSDTIVLSQPISFEIQIKKLVGDKQQLVRTLHTAPYMGTLYWKQGAVFTTIVWDQKDDKGKTVPPGEYRASVLVPVKAVGARISNPSIVQEYLLNHTRHYPIIIE